MVRQLAKLDLGTFEGLNLACFGLALQPRLALVGKVKSEDIVKALPRCLVLFSC